MIVSKDGKRRITVEEFDEMFDNGEDISDFLDDEHARWIEPEPDTVFITTLTKKINLDLPIHMIKQIDEQARRCGQPRQSLLRTWIWERLREEQERDLRLGIPPLKVEPSVIVQDPSKEAAAAQA
ncbi:hypothetical protein H6A23_06160 [Olsenella uli]|uniref:type II toxin-antitoxin system BrnA family antitoxin n=1 Tax=Olsenella uli TaxID=133926 RepID=UPI00195E27CF|nr:hypothetical protein [Olsenella uli]MBM6816750.1 hypothetical protein [Olsenella uli]